MDPLYGYSLVFGADQAGCIGGLNFAGFAGWCESNPALTVRRFTLRPLRCFQMMFAITHRL